MIQTRLKVEKNQGKRSGILVFKDTLLQNLNICFWFSQGIELLDDKLKNLQEKCERISNRTQL
jgi:hypothetical protein